MNNNHLSAWEQEEYLLDQRTPQMIRHLSECADCREAIAGLEHGIGIYRKAALEWSAESLAVRPQPYITASRQPALTLRWAMAAIIPILLLLLALIPFHLSSHRSAQPVAQISDDALLDQVDEQTSVAVPSSMESLTHLVSTDNHADHKGSKPLVQSN